MTLPVLPVLPRTLSTTACITWFSYAKIRIDSLFQLQNGLPSIPKKRQSLHTILNKNETWTLKMRLWRFSEIGSILNWGHWSPYLENKQSGIKIDQLLWVRSTLSYRFLSIEYPRSSTLSLFTTKPHLSLARLLFSGSFAASSAWCLCFEIVRHVFRTDLIAIFSDSIEEGFSLIADIAACVSLPFPLLPLHTAGTRIAWLAALPRWCWGSYRAVGRRPPRSRPTWTDSQTGSRV